MRRWVKFKMTGNDGSWMEVKGYEGGVLPVDKAAELVLASELYPINKVVVKYKPEDEKVTEKLTYMVMKTSEDPL